MICEREFVCRPILSKSSLFYYLFFDTGDLFLYGLILDPPVKLLYTVLMLSPLKFRVVANTPSP